MRAFNGFIVGPGPLLTDSVDLRILAINSR